MDFEANELHLTRSPVVWMCRKREVAWDTWEVTLVPLRNLQQRKALQTIQNLSNAFKFSKMDLTYLQLIACIFKYSHFVSTSEAQAYVLTKDK